MLEVNCSTPGHVCLYWIISVLNLHYCKMRRCNFSNRKKSHPPKFSMPIPWMRALTWLVSVWNHQPQLASNRMIGVTMGLCFHFTLFRLNISQPYLFQFSFFVDFLCYHVLECANFYVVKCAFIHSTYGHLSSYSFTFGFLLFSFGSHDKYSLLHLLCDF